MTQAAASHDAPDPSRSDECEVRDTAGAPVLHIAPPWFTPYAAGLVFVFAAMAWPLAAGVTTTRLALGVTAVLIVLRLMHVEGRTAASLLVIPAFATLAFLAYAVSYLVNGGSVWPVVSWLFLGILGWAIAECAVSFREDDYQRFFAGCTLTVALIVGLVLVRLYLDGVLFSPGIPLRLWFDRNVPMGLNRFLNGLSLVYMILLGVLGTTRARSNATRALILASSLPYLYLVVATGSRQALLALVLFALLLGSWNTLVRGIRLTPTRIAVALAVLGSIAFAVWHLARDWLAARFASFFFKGTLTGGDQDRLGAFVGGLRASYEHWTGIGPGRFNFHFGIDAHNGYINMLAEIGLFFAGPLLAILVLVVFCLIITSANRHLPLFRVVTSAFITLLVCMVNLNDILREPLFWVTLGLFAGLARGAFVPGPIAMRDEAGLAAAADETFPGSDTLRVIWQRRASCASADDR